MSVPTGRSGEPISLLADIVDPGSRVWHSHAWGEPGLLAQEGGRLCRGRPRADNVPLCASHARSLVHVLENLMKGNFIKGTSPDDS